MKKPEFPKPRIIREGLLPEQDTIETKPMNRKSFIDPADYINIFIILVFVLMFVGAPLVGISRVITTQQALNQECKTNYNFIQVALSGDNLARLCQIKNQTVTIK
jgi:hypothetical protein